MQPKGNYIKHIVVITYEKYKTQRNTPTQECDVSNVVLGKNFDLGSVGLF